MSAHALFMSGCAYHVRKRRANYQIRHRKRMQAGVKEREGHEKKESKSYVQFALVQWSLCVHFSSFNLFHVKIKA